MRLLHCWCKTNPSNRILHKIIYNISLFVNKFRMFHISPAIFAIFKISQVQLPPEPFMSAVYLFYNLALTIRCQISLSEREEGEVQTDTLLGIWTGLNSLHVVFTSILLFIKFFFSLSNWVFWVDIILFIQEILYVFLSLTKLILFLYFIVHLWGKITKFEIFDAWITLHNMQISVFYGPVLDTLRH